MRTRLIITTAIPLVGLLVALAGLLTPATASAYSRLGTYQTMGDLPRDWESPYPLVSGLPMVPYDWGPQRNPTTLSQYGLANWSIWVRYHDARRLRVAKRVGRWLLRHQTDSGGWEYRFDCPVPGTNMILKSGWISALAQGQAISLLTRLYSQTHDRKYLASARRALTPFFARVEHGGVATIHNRHPWFEEYPAPRPTLVLNGHIQALLGLYDMARHSPAAREMFLEGASSVVQMLPEYDSDGWSLYNLGYQLGFRPLRALPDYQSAHVRLLRELNSVFPHHTLTEWADRWDD